MIYRIWLVGLLTYVLTSFKLQLVTMEKTNLSILLFVIFLTSLCNSNDYKYDDYKYDNYNNDKYYDYINQNPEDYTDEYSQELNDYYDQNLLAPPNPPLPPPIPPPPPMGKITFPPKSKQIKLWHWKHICISSKYVYELCMWKMSEFHSHHRSAFW